MLKLAKDYKFLADTQDLLRKQQLEKIEDKYHDVNKLISLETVLRDVFDKPDKRVKKKDLVELIGLVSSSFTPADKEKASLLLTMSERDDVSTEEVKELLTPRTAESSFPMPTEEPSTVPAAAEPAVRSQDEINVDRAIIEFNKIKVASNRKEDIQRASLEVQIILDTYLKTAQSRALFKKKLGNLDAYPAYKTKFLKETGITLPTVGKGIKKSKRKI